MVQPEPVGVDAALRSMESLLEHLAGEGVTVEMDLQAEDTCVLIDPPSFEQVLTNLVVNAREAMESEVGSAATVRIATRRMAGRDLPPGSPLREADHGGEEFLELSVRDTGHGMDAETRKRAFDPFFTTKSRGSGLGLSTVYGIVTQAEGGVGLESGPGRGTTVRIHLPAMHERSAGASGGVEAASAGSDSTGGGEGHPTRDPTGSRAP